MASDTPPPDDYRHGALIDEGGRLVRGLIAEVRAQIAGRTGPSLSLAFLRWLLRHYIAPAEAILRRALHLIADTLPPLAPAARRAAPPPKRSAPATGPAQPRAPVFRLTERLPAPPTPYMPLNLRPRVSVPGLTPIAPAAPPPGKPNHARMEARLFRRLAALEAAWNDPRRAALRLQRLRARRKPRAPMLSAVRIPGAASRALNEVNRRTLLDLNAAAAPADTS